MGRVLQTGILTVVGSLAGALFGGFASYLIIFLFQMFGFEENSYWGFQTMALAAIIGACIMGAAWRLEPLYQGSRSRSMSIIIGLLAGGSFALLAGRDSQGPEYNYVGLYVGAATGLLAGLLIGLGDVGETDQKPDQSKDWDSFYKRRGKE